MMGEAIGRKPSIERLDFPRVGVRLTLSEKGKTWHRTVEQTEAGNWRAGLAGLDGVKFADFAEAVAFAESDLRMEADDYAALEPVRWQGRRDVDEWLRGRLGNG